MKKRDVKILIIVVAVMTLYGFGRGFLRAALVPAGSEQAMREVALELNRDLPKTLDAHTQLAFASGNDHLLSFHYKISRGVADLETRSLASELRPKIVSETCGDRELYERFLAKSITVRHAFQDRDGIPIASIDVTGADCPKP
ncbi:MAG TPA: hypothetical protein VHW00_18910 [Thermoanaerobaculia bacterium]|nr:hypothetical protein [Thermoanaerobaculia bacterium]